MRTVALLGLLLTMSACVGWMPKRRASPDIGGAPSGDRGLPQPMTGTKGAGVSSKAVYGKREPVTIIAQDKTECIVSEKKFRELAVGEKVRCEWRVP